MATQETYLNDDYSQDVEPTLSVNDTCPNGIRGFLQSHYGNGDAYRAICLEIAAMYVDGGFNSFEEIGDHLSEQDLILCVACCETF